ncbi:phytanoyl-CoA dioxygenase family protein [Bradyrhizobium lablabi]|uniref:phytanoyl-CoA dioxygenase family protein n=1 Tax=Bradyrhizobium lablabi TaxID=722472 RepID=UPI001BA6166B|nr:phytanoyl-CoA dioxygenase family protein [Bradyrhizobium lablabi]MBR0696577.1 phytanoyl-CoA dioxygenase family protein [Bradyrhizobium lablabi]
MQKINERIPSDKIIADIHTNGFAIVENVIEEQALRRIKTEMSSLFELASFGENEFHGYRTRRIHGLLAKTRALDVLVMHPVALVVAEAILGAEFQLSIGVGIEILPGESAQPLHREGDLYPSVRADVTTVLSSMWTLTEFTERNGATRMVRESHLGREGATVVATAGPGSLILWQGKTLHAAGANLDSTSRIGINFDYNLGWLRQQENQYLSIPPPIAARLPERLQRLIGYQMSSRGRLGQVNFEDPIRLLQ